MTPRQPDSNKTPRVIDRYSANELRRARDLGNQLDRPAHDQVRIVKIAILDPDQDPNRKPGQTSRVNVNWRGDILDYEAKHHRISAAAFRAGRVVQGVFERAHLGGASTWAAGSRVDTSRAKEMAVVRKLLNARTIRAHLQWMRGVLGSKDAEIVRQVLGENRRYGEVELDADLVRGKLARAAFEHAQLVQPMLVPEYKKDISYIAHRFRDALESLATTRNEPPEGDSSVPTLRKFVCAKCRRTRIVNPSFPDDYTPTVCTPCLDLEETAIEPPE